MQFYGGLTISDWHETATLRERMALAEYREQYLKAKAEAEAARG